MQDFCQGTRFARTLTYGVLVNSQDVVGQVEPIGIT
jgi:hypothetical protein